MRVRLRPLPVVFACAGCPEFGGAAADFARRLDRRGLAEAALLGAALADPVQLAAKARSRFPVYAADGCAKGCALRWLRERGARVERHFDLGRSRKIAP